MDGVIKFLITAGSVTVLSFAIALYQNRRKRAELLKKEQQMVEKILTSPKTSWKKVGTVKEIFHYPLKSAKGKPVKQCNFELNGMSVDQQGLFSLKDRMFLVFNEETKKFITARERPKLILIDLSAVDEDHAKLQVDDMTDLVFKLPKHNDKGAQYFDCTMWWGERVKCLDCGPEANAWLSKFLTGSDSTCRLGMYLPDNKRDLKVAWKGFTELYANLRNEDAGIFSDLASYMVLSNQSVEDLNERLTKPIIPLQLRPNILVEGCQAYAEDGWEWIKIGEKAIIRNFKLCTRCRMVGVDPETGISDPKSETLKTLRSYRKLKDPELDKLENYAPHMGIYCGLYQAGPVHLGDEIYVYQSS